MPVVSQKNIEQLNKILEHNLDKLLEMAYKEYKEAINVKADDKIILGRKNKNA